MWRMTDGVKRKVWFEWAASAYLCASALSFPPSSSPRHSAASPPASSTSGSFAPASRQDTLSPRGGAWDHQRNSYASSSQRGSASPMVDAFQSAPSPMIGGGGGPHGDRRDSGRMQGIEEEEGGSGGAAQGEQRILISMSKLHNPGGKSSFVGL